MPFGKNASTAVYSPAMKFTLTDAYFCSKVTNCEDLRALITWMAPCLSAVMKSTGAVVFLCCAIVSAQQNQLTDQGIVTLVQSGVSQAEVVRVISKAQNFNFDLRPVSTDWMLKAGVSEDIIRSMSARQNNRLVDAPEAVTSPKTAIEPNVPQSVSPSDPPHVFAENKNGGYKLTYDGGSVTDLKSGTGMKLFLDSNQIRIVKDGVSLISLPASAVTEISYGQDVHRRVGAAIGLALVSFGIGALMALTKSKKHFIGLTWDDGGKKGGAAFQADKNDYRGVLAGLEGVTGKKAINSDTLTVKN
jgi:hypothetical protein